VSVTELGAASSLAELEPVERAQPPGRRAPVIGSVWADLAVPALIRVGQMLVQVGLVAGLNAGTGHSLFGRFTIWDAQLYAHLARSGYPAHIAMTGGRLTSGGSLAFSPGYPALTSLLHAGTGLGIPTALVVGSCVAGCALSILVHLVVRSAGRPRRTGYLACWLIGVLPMSVVLQMGYAESLGAALSAGAVLAAARRRWVLAGVLAFLAGATRPTGYVVAAAILTFGLLARRDEDDHAPSRGRLAAVTLLGLASTPLFWGFVALRTGRLGGWFEIESDGWGTHFDAGRDSAHFVWSTLGHPDRAGFAAVATVLVLLAAIVAVTTIADRAHLPFVVLGVITLASVLGSTNFWHSKPRLLLSAAVLVIPLAEKLPTARVRSLAPGLLLAFLASSWFGAYLVTQFPYAI
jgi:hypothetical protein